MSEKDRRPLGERDENERTLPFGSQPARHRRSLPEEEKKASPYDPYAAGPDIPLPRRDREDGIDPALPYRNESPRRAAPHYGDEEGRISRAYEQAGYLDEDEGEAFEEEENAAALPEDFFNFSFEPEPAAEKVSVSDASPAPRQRSVSDPDTAGLIGGAIDLNLFLRMIGTMLAVAVGVATVFTWWSPGSFLSAGSSLPLVIAQATYDMAGVNPPGPIATSEVDPALYEARSIGLVSGHRGIYPDTGLPDPGAICADGLTEASINEDITLRVMAKLTEMGYYVDVFDEFDPALSGYRARAMISIHADTCDYINDIATGFKVASFEVSTSPEEDQLLTACLIEHYGAITGLSQHPSVTYDMTHYHNFAELDPETPGAIIEVGFMYLDRAFLTEQADVAAEGIVQGIICFLNNDAVD